MYIVVIISFMLKCENFLTRVNGGRVDHDSSAAITSWIMGDGGGSEALLCSVSTMFVVTESSRSAHSCAFFQSVGFCVLIGENKQGIHSI